MYYPQYYAAFRSTTLLSHNSVVKSNKYSLFSVAAKFTYKKIGDGMTCGNDKSWYTYTGKTYCDGWSGISLEECQAKCTRNEVPNAKCPRQGVKCKFVHYTHGTNWCHLADDTMQPCERSQQIYNHHEGRWVNLIYLRFEIAFLKAAYFHVQFPEKLIGTPYFVIHIASNFLQKLLLKVQYSKCYQDYKHLSLFCKKTFFISFYLHELYARQVGRQIGGCVCTLWCLINLPIPRLSIFENSSHSPGPYQDPPFINFCKSKFQQL